MPNFSVVSLHVRDEIPELPHHQHRHFSDGDAQVPALNTASPGAKYIKSPATMSEPQHDPIESLTPEEASRIIHSHRKVRYGVSSTLKSTNERRILTSRK